MIVPDQVTFDYVGRPFAPRDEAWTRAIERRSCMTPDEGATFDRKVFLDASEIAPMVTWGTSLEDVAAERGDRPDHVREQPSGDEGL